MNEILSHAILFLPVILLPLLAQELWEDGVQIAMAGVLGGVGAIIGFPIYWLSKDKSTGIKIGILSIMLICLIGVIIYFT